MQGVWTTRWCLPHESAFNRLQKYAWANLASASDIARDLFGVKVSSSTSVRFRELLCGDWISQSKLHPPPGLTLQDGFVSAYGGTWPRLLASATAFRYCECCLREGYHSILFQIEGLTKCPRHGLPLRSQCPHCGSRTACLALQKLSFLMPFHCRECGRPLAEPLDPRLWIASTQQFNEIKQALQPLASWLQQLDTYPNHYLETPLAQFALAGEFSSESEELVSFEIARHLVPLEIPQDRCGQSRRPLAYRWVVNRPNLSLGKIPPADVLIHPAIYKSIRNYLLRTYLSAHRDCLRVAYTSVYVNRIPPAVDEVMQEIDVCPVAAAFKRWELRYIARRQDVQNTLRRFASGLLRDAYYATDALSAARILADFYACAATAYEYEIWTQSGGPQSKGNSEFLTRLLPYCSLWASGSSLWALTSQPDRARVKAYFVVSGDASFVNRLEASNNEKCGHAKMRHRPPRSAPPRSVDAATQPTRDERIREIWSDTCIRPYESALSVLLKYMNDNPTLSGDWQRLVFAAGISNRSLLTGQGVLKPRPDIAAGAAVVKGTLRAYGLRWRCGLRIADHVRFCPDCRKQGYHCVFFQIRELQICPMHREQLRDRCVCSALTPTYDMVRARPAQSFACKECGEPILGTAAAKSVGDAYLSADYLELKLQPLADWIRRAERTHLPDPPWRNRVPIAELIPPTEKQGHRPGWTSSRRSFDLFPD